MVVVSTAEQKDHWMLSKMFGDQKDLYTIIRDEPPKVNPLAGLAITQMYIDDLAPIRQEQRYTEPAPHRRTGCITAKERAKRSAKRKQAKQAKQAKKTKRRA